MSREQQEYGKQKTIISFVCWLEKEISREKTRIWLEKLLFHLFACYSFVYLVICLLESINRDKEEYGKKI